MARGMWQQVLRRAADCRARLSAIDGLRVYGEDDLPPGAELDRTKILIDLSDLGMSGYAVDDWLNEHHRISVGLSDMRHLLVIVSAGTRSRDVRALCRALAGCISQVRGGTLSLPSARSAPRIGSLLVEMAGDPADAFFGPVEHVPLSSAAGRIAAEMIAPAPPGVPRLVPGQRISQAHVDWLVAQRDAGAFFLDPIDPSERTVRVTADHCHRHIPVNRARCRYRVPDPRRRRRSAGSRRSWRIAGRRGCARCCGTG